ncbi:MAG: type II secretion system protein GspD [Verrucomicrobia bacterium]|nr:type II secretion system protein GspD [Verrucomicrobiota bacterium]
MIRAIPGACLGGLLLLTACRSPEAPSERQSAQPASAVPSGRPADGSRAASEYVPPAVLYNPLYDPEIKDILALAGKAEWEEAEHKANLLAQRAPDDNAINRLKEWVGKQRQLQREKALEDRIRQIDASSSPFNPTLLDLINEKKDRGLPPRKDVRDTVGRIESTPYIPDTYGKTVHQQGPLFDVASTNSRMQVLLEKEVTIHLDNVTLEAVIQQVSQTAGVNFVADKSLPAFKQTLSIHLDKVRLGEFLKYLARNYELQFQIGSELMWVVDAKDPKKLMEETRFYRLRKGFVLPAKFGSEDITKQRVTTGNVTTQTEIETFKKFVNDEAPERPYLEQAITNLFTGKYLIDYEHNLIVAHGTPEQLELLEKIIEEFDRPIQQVLIEARFVTLSKPAFLQLGVLWETGRRVSDTRSAQDYTGMISSESLQNVGLGLQETFTNILDRETLSATISALEQTGESQTLSAPRLTVLNNRPATIRDGLVQYYYEEFTVRTSASTERISVSSFVPSGKPSKVTAGAELDVMASVGGDGRSVVLALNPRVNSEVTLQQSYSLQVEGADEPFVILLPQYRTQELATRVVVRSGETVVMGGVLERQQSTYVESVPVLGNLPLLGWLFRRRTELDRPRYLLVFVTATILSESGEFVVYDESAPAADVRAP